MRTGDASVIVPLAPVAGVGPARRGFCATVRESTSRFLREYVREWQPTDERAVVRLGEALQRLKFAIDGNDVAVFVKPGGLCPFCTLTEQLLHSAQAAHGCLVHVEDLLHDEREGLKMMLVGELGERVLTYPVIYLRGARVIGGYEEFKTLHDSAEGLAPALGRERILFEPPDRDRLLETLPSKSERPRLFYQAGGGSWCAFQQLLFGNVLRVIALFQVVLLVLALSLQSSSPHAAALVLAIVGVDAAVFVLVGPAPFAPLGALATLVAWRRRGSVASAVPYKFTFALYAVGCLANLPCAFGTEAGSGEDGTNCPLPNGESLATTLLVNSSILATFRF
mmetsp:Transcript_46229/g.128468  ORF Transcript_46229/g.128468 Transcript_46229/m.128468 type:complete len:338 (+) Transcript_46229:85-1098(+)